MGAQRAAWQVAFQAEIAFLKRKYYAQSLLDLTKAFERGPHALLVQAAVKHEYCLWTLRLSLAAYGLPRAIGEEGVFSKLLIATVGITVGSGFATTELRVLFLETIDMCSIRYTEICLTIYVDDFTVEAMGDKYAVIRDVAAATNFIVHTLEQGLLLDVSKKKSFCIGSSPQIARGIARKVKSGKVQASREGKMLGAAAVGGNRRSTKVLKDCLKVVATRMPRCKTFRSAGVNASKVAAAAGNAAITYRRYCRLQQFSPM